MIGSRFIKCSCSLECEEVRKKKSKMLSEPKSVEIVKVTLGLQRESINHSVTESSLESCANKNALAVSLSIVMKMTIWTHDFRRRHHKDYRNWCFHSAAKPCSLADVLCKFYSNRGRGIARNSTLQLMMQKIKSHDNCRFTWHGCVNNDFHWAPLLWVFGSFGIELQVHFECALNFRIN